MRVCTFMYILVHVHVCVNVCVGQWLTAGILCQPLFTVFWVRESQVLTEPRACRLGWDRHQLVSVIPFHPPSTEIAVQLPHVPASSWLLGIWTSVLRFAQQILFPLCHLPLAFKPAVNYQHINLPRPLSLLRGPPVLQKSELFWFPVSRQMSGRQNFPLNIKFNSLSIFGIFQRPWPYTKQTGASCKSNWNMAMAYEGSGNRAWIWVQALLPTRHSPAEPRPPPPSYSPYHQLSSSRHSTMYRHEVGWEQCLGIVSKRPSSVKVDFMFVNFFHQWAFLLFGK